MLEPMTDGEIKALAAKLLPTLVDATVRGDVDRRGKPLDDIHACLEIAVELSHIAAILFADYSVTKARDIVRILREKPSA